MWPLGVKNRVRYNSRKRFSISEPGQHIWKNIEIIRLY